PHAYPVFRRHFQKIRYLHCGQTVIVGQKIRQKASAQTKACAFKAFYATSHAAPDLHGTTLSFATLAFTVGLTFGSATALAFTAFAFGTLVFRRVFTL